MKIKICNEISKTICRGFCEKVGFANGGKTHHNPRENNESGRELSGEQRRLEAEEMAQDSPHSVSLIAVALSSSSRHSHERLVARSDLLNEDVIFRINERLDAAVRTLNIQHWLTAQQANLFETSETEINGFRLLASELAKASLTASWSAPEMSNFAMALPPWQWPAFNTQGNFCQLHWNESKKTKG
jgi:hypothetical protein